MYGFLLLSQRIGMKNKWTVIMDGDVTLTWIDHMLREMISFGAHLYLYDDSINQTKSVFILNRDIHKSNNTNNQTQQYDKTICYTRTLVESIPPFKMIHDRI
jgi:hypothetical protein